MPLLAPCWRTELIWKRIPHPFGSARKILLDIGSPLPHRFRPDWVINPMVLVGLNAYKLTAPAWLAWIFRIANPANAAYEVKKRRRIAFDHPARLRIPARLRVDTTEEAVPLSNMTV
jgi:hypothetical protein